MAAFAKLRSDLQDCKGSRSPRFLFFDGISWIDV